jgi:hypothetical protein
LSVAHPSWLEAIAGGLLVGALVTLVFHYGWVPGLFLRRYGDPYLSWRQAAVWGLGIAAAAAIILRLLAAP